ncbi:MAG: hypothetical protein FWB91_07530 [Defluviitaleaceae bacterium]|nr:hypothetical protein [Defluviitaleaceae bacterium]
MTNLSQKSIFIRLGGVAGFARCAVAHAPLVSREKADSALLGASSSPFGRAHALCGNANQLR